MQKFTIHNRFDNSVIVLEREGVSLKEIVIAAVASGADLYGANLYGADLSRADLSGANLSGANLYGADLSRANLSRANLSRANLYGADLSKADLSRANLYRANLSKANLSGANLYGADLYGADLSRADLSRADLYGADLSTVKHDVWDVLLRVPNEIGFLLDALRGGRVNGSVYKDDSGCGCLVGTLAIGAHKGENELEFLKPNGSRPAERWFLAIRKGDTAETSNVVKLTIEWVEEFEMLMSRAVTMRTVAK